MMVAGTADFTGYRVDNPDADLSFIAWPGPEAGKTATTTGMELLYTVSAFSPADKQEAATKFVAWLATAEAQQLVSDKIALPVHTGVTGSTDPIRAQTVEANKGGEVPVWYDLPEVNGSVTAVTDNHGGLWTGRLTAQQFAEAVQAVVVPNPNVGGGATPVAEATPTYLADRLTLMPGTDAPESTESMKRARAGDLRPGASLRLPRRLPSPLPATPLAGKPFVWFILPALVAYSRCSSTPPPGRST
jgi:hypothetical protein